LTSAGGAIGLLRRGIDVTHASPPVAFDKEIAVTRSIAKFLSDEEGAVATEYSVMLMLILMGVFAAVTAVGGQSGGMWGGIVSRFTGGGFTGSQ
jgi:Flp pilus assembly pilin Flp